MMVTYAFRWLNSVFILNGKSTHQFRANKNRRAQDDTKSSDLSKLKKKKNSRNQFRENIRDSIWITVVP